MTSTAILITVASLRYLLENHFLILGGPAEVYMTRNILLIPSHLLPDIEKYKGVRSWRWNVCLL